MKSKIHIITGVAGFIGSKLAGSLLKDGYTILGIDNFMLGTLENINYLKKLSTNFHFFEKDLSKYKNLDGLIKDLNQFGDIDCIWHLAANSDISGSVDALSIDLENTFFTTISTGILCEKLNIKEVVFSSSSAVLGTVPIKISEEHGPLLPESYYGAMKLASESYLSALKTYTIDKYTFFRFPNVIGKDTTHGIVYDFKNKLSSKPQYLNVLGDGNQKKPYLYIDDLIEGMIELRNVNFENRIFNLSPLDSGITVREIAEIAVNILSPKTVPKYEEKSFGWPGDVTRYEYNTDKLIKTGWKPKFTSEEAIRKSFEIT